MTERVATRGGNGSQSEWLKPSYWWDTVTGPRGAPAPTGWVRLFNVTDGSAIIQSTGTGHGRGSFVIAHDGIWVANQGSRTVARLEPRTLEMSAIQRFRKAPVAIAAGPDAVWALASSGWLWRIQPDTQRGEGIARLGRRATSLAAAGDLIWVLRWNGRLYGVEPAGGEVVVEARLPRRASHMVAHEDALWVSCGRNRRLVKVDPQTGRPSAEIRLAQGIRAMVATDNALLAGCARALSRRQGWLQVIDAPNQRIASTVDLPSQPRAIAANGKTAWIACGRGPVREGTLEQVDLGSGEVTHWRTTDWAISDLALLDDKLLASMSLALAVPTYNDHIIGGGGGGGNCGGGGHGGGGHGGGHC